MSIGPTLMKIMGSKGNKIRVSFLNVKKKTIYKSSKILSNTVRLSLILNQIKLYYEFSV